MMWSRFKTMLIGNSDRRSALSAGLRRPGSPRARAHSAFAVPMLLLSLVIVTVVSLGLTGCGDDLRTYKPSDGQSPFLPLTSPENVLHNLAESYNLRDYEHFEELLRQDFVFIFNESDVRDYPWSIPQSGFWGYADELMATNHMFDSAYVPEDPLYKVDEIQMLLALSEALTPSILQMAPPGTLRGHATLDLEVTVGGNQVIMLVHSQPLFFFAPDSSHTPVLWRLWRCDDAPYPEDALVAGAGGREPGCGVNEPGGVSPRRLSAQGIASKHSSWGLVKAFYRGHL